MYRLIAIGRVYRSSDGVYSYLHWVRTYKSERSVNQVRDRYAKARYSVTVETV